LSQILVVDDDANQRELLSWELTDEGYTVETASDGREALQMMRCSPPDVVVLDLSMHGLNGIDTMSQILNFQRRPFVGVGFFRSLHREGTRPDTYDGPRFLLPLRRRSILRPWQGY